jgi:DNA modification methylase
VPSKHRVPEISVSVDIQVERWRIERLIPRANNPRTHSREQIASIAASIQEFGWTNPVLVDGDDCILAGHARVLAARKLGMAEIPVIVLKHLSPAQRRALVIADNQLAITGAGWDEELLRIELALLHEEDYNVDLLGFDDIELQRLLEAQDTEPGLIDEDAVPEPPETPITVPADLWILGDHRVLCADATVIADVERLMAGDAVDLVFSDSPYNVDYTGYTEDQLKITGDRMTAEEFQQFLLASFSSYRHIMKPGASMYVCHSSSWQREFQNAMETAGFEVRCQLIWAKNTFAWGFGRYKFRHEPIFYAHVAGQKDAWYGDKTQSTLWEEKKPAANRIHPTAKPVELVERSLVNSSKAGDIVADLFGGSGSTLIGCERRGRKARLMEIDPKYADCIVQRWQEYTGKKAVLDGDGRTFDELAECRRSVAACVGADEKEEPI